VTSRHRTIGALGLGLLLVALGRDRVDAASTPAPPKTDGSACRLGGEVQGHWRAEPQDVLAAARAIPGGLCAPRATIVGALASCMVDGGGAAVVVDLTPSAKYSACTLSVATLEYERRRFVKLDVFEGIGNHFHGVVHISEIVDRQAREYYFGYDGNNGLCDGGRAGNAPSQEMVREWPTLARHVRDWMC
jgi:hypothetical protein